MPMHEFTQHCVKLLSYLEGGYLCRMMELPTAQEKSEQISFAQPKAHQNKFTDLNKTVPTNKFAGFNKTVPTHPLKMIAFFEQCHATKAAGILKKIARTRSSRWKRKQLIFLLRVAVNGAIVSIIAVNIATTIKATDGTTMITNPTILIETIDVKIALKATTRTQRAPSPMTRRMIASAITPRKKQQGHA
jgi:hypothetical protein